MEQMRSGLDEALRVSAVRLIEQLDEELQRQGRGAPTEPVLPQPRPDGMLAELTAGS